MLVIPRVRRTGGLEQPARDAMRFQILGRPTHNRGEVEQLFDQLRLGGFGQHAEVDARTGHRRRIDLTDAEDAAHARVCHLHIVDGVFFRLTAREIDIEDQLRVAAAHEIEIAHRIAADFVDEVTHRDVRAGALGDLHLFTALHDGHHLMQHVVGIAFRNADFEGLQTGPHARRGAVVIGALHIDGTPIAALPLGDVVRDIRHEISVVTALRRALLHDAILVVPELRRAQEQGALFFEGMPRGAQLIDGLLDATVGLERAFKIVRVERDAERLQVEILFVAQCGDGERLHRLEIMAGRILGMLLHVRLRNFPNVFAVISAVGNRERGTAEFTHARLGALREVCDLRAGIVVVKLAIDVPSGPLEQRADGVAERSLTPVTDVEWPGRVGGHELDHHVHAVTNVDTSPRVRAFDDGKQSACKERRIEAKVDEAWSGDLCAGHSDRGQVHRRDEGLGNLSRFLP